MGDRESLYRAILAAPDDDAPRLVYADWLDDHGDPDRAEFIRLQCELNQIILGIPAALDRYSAIQKRCGALVEAHYKRWVQELGPLPPNRQLSFWFRRGMVAVVTCPAKYFLAHGERLFEVAPLELVAFQRLTPGHVLPLRACPWSARVREFCLQCADGVEQVVRTLLADWPFPRLEAWDLGSRVHDLTSTTWHERWADVTVAIAGSACLRSLRRLSLDACGIGDEGGRALAVSPHLADLDVLDLKNNPMIATVRKRLRKRFGRRVFFNYSDHDGFRVGDLL